MPKVFARVLYNVNVSAVSSYAWKSIMRAFNHLKDGYKVRVGVGEVSFGMIAGFQMVSYVTRSLTLIFRYYLADQGCVC